MREVYAKYSARHVRQEAIRWSSRAQQYMSAAEIILRIMLMLVIFLGGIVVGWLSMLAMICWACADQ